MPRASKSWKAPRPPAASCSLIRARRACELANGKMTITEKMPTVATRMAKRTSTMVTAERGFARRGDCELRIADCGLIMVRTGRLGSMECFSLCHRLLAVGGLQPAIGEIGCPGGGCLRIQNLLLVGAG